MVQLEKAVPSAHGEFERAPPPVFPASRDNPHALGAAPFGKGNLPQSQAPIVSSQLSLPREPSRRHRSPDDPDRVTAA